jgi:hypothetical protein
MIGGLAKAGVLAPRPQGPYERISKMFVYSRAGLGGEPLSEADARPRQREAADSRRLGASNPEGRHGHAERRRTSEPHAVERRRNHRLGRGDPQGD